MARIDGYEVPPEIVEEMKKMLAGVEDRAILDYVRDLPEIFDGFRPGAKRAAGVVRKRIAGILDTDYELDCMFMALLASGSEITDFIASVSRVVLEDALDALAALNGRNAALAALLVDYRSEVREMAMDVLDGDVELQDMTEEGAKSDIRECTAPLLAGIAGWMGINYEDAGTPEGAPSAEASPAAGKESARLRQRVDELEHKLAARETRAKSEKALRKKLEQVKQKTQKLEKSLQEAQKEIARGKQAHDDIREDLRTTREREDELRQSLERRVAQGVADELSSLRERWLLRPVTVEKEAEAVRRIGAESDSLAAAERLLEKQAELDRHSGNIAVLKSRAEALRGMVEKVAGTRAEALHPLAELEQVEKRLQAELVRLEDVLGRSDDGDAGFVAGMRGRINSAGSGDDVNRLKDVLDRLDEIEALPPARLQSLYKAYHDRMARLYAAYTPNVVRREQRRDDPAWHLQRAVEENQPLIIILDGHNVVHLLPALFEDAYQEGVPGKDAREKLVENVCRVFGPADKCRAEVFFDGPTHSSQMRAPNVRETFSGGGDAEHRADKAIVEYLDYCCRHMSAMPRILVTDDRDLRSEGGVRGARIMPVPEFGAFLECACA